VSCEYIKFHCFHTSYRSLTKSQLTNIIHYTVVKCRRIFFELLHFYRSCAERLTPTDATKDTAQNLLTQNMRSRRLARYASLYSSLNTLICRSLYVCLSFMRPLDLDAFTLTFELFTSE